MVQTKMKTKSKKKNVTTVATQKQNACKKKSYLQHSNIYEKIALSISEEKIPLKHQYLFQAIISCKS
jgi:hypothetical protein